MRKLSYLLIFTYLIVSGCGSGDDLSEKKANGGAAYGGIFRFKSSEKITTLLSVSSSSIYTQRVASQLFETLLTLDPESEKVVPGLAENYTVNPSATVFTFKIRRGVKFHEDDCFDGEERELTAHDVKNTLDFACSKTVDNEIYWMLINVIKGAKENYNSSKKGVLSKGVSGIKVINENTLSIELVYPFIGFDKLLAHRSLGVFPKEAFIKYGEEIGKHPVGTGPFMLEEWDEEKITLTRNSNYWKKDEFGNQLPFLSGVEVTYAKDKKSELLAFRNQEIDLVLQIPAEEIDNVLGSLADAQAGKNIKHKIDSKASLSTAYYGFANGSEPFNNPNVRKAFNLAIDRDFLVNNWMQGDGYPCINGFVPAMGDYDDTKIKGYGFDIAQAKELIAKAGYPGGSGFPKISLYVNTKEGSVIHKLALGVIKQLKENLNITIPIKLCSIEERDKAILNGDAKFWRGGWIADYPDPENFLNLFHSKNIGSTSVISNPFRYKSVTYDKLLEMAMKESNPIKRTNLFVQCDQQVIDEAVVMPIYHSDFMTMINNRVKNFHTNATEIIDCSRIFIREAK
jgi:peptide/nickel transport system substrate-binding protein